MDIIKILSEEFSVKEHYVKNIIDLIDADNTIPFIARYRKEVTGNLSDETLRDLGERLTYLRNLEKRKEEVIRLIDEQGKLTDELTIKIASTMILSELEDIYRPYKPKKRTRATIAKEKGLEPLAEIIYAQEEKKDIYEMEILHKAEVEELQKRIKELEETIVAIREYYKMTPKNIIKRILGIFKR